MKKTYIKSISKRQAKKNSAWNDLVFILFLNRAEGVCELCGRSGGLQGHHIIKRSQGGKNIASNTLILDGLCHKRADNPNSAMKIDGVEYPPFSITEQLDLAKKLNERHDIEE